MNIFEFITALTQALVWPIVILIVVLLMHQPLSNSIPLLKRFNALGVELEFSNQLANVKKEISDSPKIEETVKAETQSIADNSSTEIVLEAWLELKRKVFEQAIALGADCDQGSLKECIKYLKKKGVIDGKIEKILQNLEEMKDTAIAAPGTKLSIESAKSYAEEVSVLIQYFNLWSESRQQ